MAFSVVLPTLAPSIVFAILFVISSISLGWRTLEHRRYAYFLFFVFSFLRIAAFIARALWSQDYTSQSKAIATGVITSGGYFLAIQPLYTVFTEWIDRIIGLENVSNREKLVIRLIKILIPLCSLIGIVGSVKQFTASSQEQADLGTDLRKATALGFLGLLAILLFNTLIYAQRYSNSIENKGMKRVTKKSILVLVIGCLLLISGMIYRTLSVFEPTSDVNKKEWYIYVFAFAPEWILMIFVSVINLEDLLGKDNFNSDEEISNKRELAK
ncbi:5156_t:CDS:1 [Ambispora leptoticha]|uniref:5156_t:CDS:1 n=1 Tax=Ambispora leptoticha TaxID=144679 RepID=A0A9N9ER41_9GLOM|nr:5156_t:CDS:1 [Ambispora leptoticha]